MSYTLSYHHFPDNYYHEVGLAGRLVHYLEQKFPDVTFKWTLLPNEKRYNTVDNDTYEAIKRAISEYPISNPPGWDYVEPHND